MRKTALMILLLSPVLTAIAAGGEGEVTAKLEFRVGEVTRVPIVSVPLTEAAPAGVTDPEGMADAWFARRNFGPGRQLLVAAQFQPDPAWVRIDRDFDGRLEGEEPFYFSAIGSGNVWEALIEVEIPLDPMGAPEKVTLRFIHHHSATSHCLHLAVPVFKEGEVVLAGRVRTVVLADGDHDLLFETPAQDHLFLDIDGDTEVRAVTSGTEAITPGKPFRVGNGGYLAEVKKNGDVVFRPSARVPGPEETAWPRTGTVTAGRKFTGKVAPFATLEQEYRTAEEQDQTAGTNVTTNRSKVIADIGRTGQREAFSFLVDLAKSDPDMNIKSNALRATGYEIYQPYAAAIFEFAKDSGTPAVAMAAFDALHGMDAPNREPFLMEILKSTNDESIFGAAGRYLAYLGSEEGLKLLEKFATEHPKENIRYQAYQTATRYRTGPPPAAMVIAAATSSHPQLRTLGLEHALVLDLPESIDLGLAALKDTDDDKVRLAAVRLLATWNDPAAVEALFEAVGTMPDDARTEMVKLLSPVRNPASIDLICDRLADGAPPERAVAADVLSAIKTEQTTAALLARLGREKDPRALIAIIRALGVHRPPGADVKIVDAAEDTRSDPVAFAAALDALASFGLDNPKVRRFFEKALKSRDFEVRVVAVDAAAKAGGEVGADLLLEHIDDKAWQVRLTAVQGLGKVRVRRAVRPLIDRLGEEEVPRVVAAIADTLFRTTGQNFYDIVELWERWWKEHGEDFEVPVEVPEIKPDDHGGRSVASFYGVPVETDRMIFVIDQSGSMSSASGNNTKLEVAVEQTLKVVKSLGKKARLNVILFETGIHPWQKQLVKVNATTRGALKKHLESKRPMGGTNLFDGLELALLTRDVDTVYLLSDGSPGSGKFVAQDDILREVRKINRTRKIAIHCIAVGFDSPLMKELAAQNGGQYVRR